MRTIDSSITKPFHKLCSQSLIVLVHQPLHTSSSLAILSDLLVSFVSVSAGFKLVTGDRHEQWRKTVSNPFPWHVAKRLSKTDS